LGFFWGGGKKKKKEEEKEAISGVGCGEKGRKTRGKQEGGGETTREKEGFSLFYLTRMRAAQSRGATAAAAARTS
jgi:hypothetical protein